VRRQVGNLLYLNGGSWSPAFREPECKTRIGTQTFVWIRPDGTGARQAAHYEWPPGGEAAVPFEATADPRAGRSSRPDASASRPPVAPQAGVG
jgi:hypothetical protein